MSSLQAEEAGNGACLYTGTKSKGRMIEQSRLSEQRDGFLRGRAMSAVGCQAQDVAWDVNWDADCGGQGEGPVLILRELSTCFLTLFGRPVSRKLKCNVFHPLP